MASQYFQNKTSLPNEACLACVVWHLPDSGLLVLYSVLDCLPVNYMDPGLEPQDPLCSPILPLRPLHIFCVLEHFLTFSPT